MSRQVFRISVEVPMEAGPDVVDAIYDAVCDAAHDAEPEQRDGWDIFVYGIQETVADADEIADFAREIGAPLDGDF